MINNRTLTEIKTRTGQAVADYWNTRKSQQERQEQNGRSDQGLRSAVTGGAHMDGFISLFADLIIDCGLSVDFIYTRKAIELPGYFRPTKEWDLFVVKDNLLVAAVEAKSQVGPSFGNNFNNRAEEAIGSAVDLWTAFREGAFLTSPPPFLGYFFMLEDCTACNIPVRIKEPHFKSFPEFAEASYAKRYELLCRKLVLERHYTGAAFILSDRDEGLHGLYKTPAPDLSCELFSRALVAHASRFV